MKQNNSVEELVSNCLHELELASREKYDTDKAEKTAALFLVTQMNVSNVLHDVELKFKHSRNEVERIEADRYYLHKTSGEGKKTEVALTNAVSKDDEVVKAKVYSAESEASLKKWNYLSAVLRDGHLYFKSLFKNSRWEQ